MSQLNLFTPGARIVQSWSDLDWFNSTDQKSKLLDLLETREYCPSLYDVYKAFDVTPLERVKVVILGQDPYPNSAHACGLAFSVPPDVQTLPPTLKNIFKELVSDIGCDYPPNGDLRPWAERGVLLLNSSLTTDVGRPGSHRGLGWEALVYEAIRAVVMTRPNSVFILWGAAALHTFNTATVNMSVKRGTVITSAHPSPLSASRGFFGSKPFSRANEILGTQAIDWRL